MEEKNESTWLVWVYVGVYVGVVLGVVGYITFEHFQQLERDVLRLGYAHNQLAAVVDEHITKTNAPRVVPPAHPPAEKA